MEGEHAKIEHASANGSVTPATVCCRIRSIYLVRLLDEMKFAAWCRCACRTKVFRDLLAAVYHPDSMLGWNRRTQLERVYLFGLECQFQDTGRQHDALNAWELSKLRPLRALTSPKLGTHCWCLSWLKGQLKPGRWLTLPDSLVAGVVSLSGIPLRPERPLHLADLLECIANAADLDTQEVGGDLIMMRVVHAQPNNRVSQHAWDLGAKGSLLRVAMYGRGKRIGDGWEFYPRAHVMFLDLDFLASEPFAEVVRCCGVFRRLEFGTELVLKPFAASLVSGLTSAPAVAAPDAETDIVPHDMSPQAVEASVHIDFLRKSAREGAWAESGTFVQATLGLRGWHRGCSEILQHSVGCQPRRVFRKSHNELAVCMQAWF